VGAHVVGQDFDLAGFDGIQRDYRVVAIGVKLTGGSA
jgi:hypothetical protein